MAAPQRIPVFISYSNKDRAWRDQIAASLQRADLDVLDDTLLLPGQSWPQELQSMRERARVAILIITQNFLASYTIREGELPHLLDLHKRKGVRLIPVIAEPCDWQKLAAINNIQAFPQFGGPLASAPGNIAKQLEELAQIIHQLVRDANSPPAPRSPSQSKTSSRSRPRPPANPPPSSEATPEVQPSSLDSLVAANVALRLFVEGPSGPYVAMASLLSSTHAVTAFHVFSESGLHENQELTITLEGSSPAHFSTTATVVAADAIANVLLLRLSSAMPANSPESPVPSTTVAPAGRWVSYCIPADANVWIPVTGTAGGPYRSENKEYQTLVLDKPMPGAGGVSGAPVIWNGQLVGIVALASSDGSSWYATLISRETIEKLVLTASQSGRSENWLSQSDIDSFSPATREIIMRANQRRLERKLNNVHMRDLLRALAGQEAGQFARLLEEVGVDLDSVIQEEKRRSTEPRNKSLGPDKLPPMSDNVRRALIGARNKAKEQGSKTIEESHLLYGALTITDHSVIQALKERGITADQVTFDFMPEPRRINDLLAGVQSDAPAGEDLLDITPEVNALASVLAANDADPPLALGLFGEWGSGKSFFMSCLETRIRALQEDAQKARQEEKKSAYCEDIVQITFNAWNYIDTNLWASLATEIFEGLASAMAKRRGSDSQEERALVLAAASSSQEVLAETERKKSAAEADLKQIQQQLTLLQESQSNIEANLSPAELFKQAYRFAVAQDQVKKPLEEVAGALKVREGMAATGQIKQEILELRGFWSTLIFTLKHGQNLWLWLLIFGVLLVVGAAFRYAVKSPSLHGLANSVVAALVAIGGGLATFRAWANKALTLIRAAQQSKQQLIEDKKQEQTAGLKAQYKEVQERVQKATEAAAAVSQRVNKINQQLENMRADRKMADYIRQRNESTDYTQHLGIIARVRADFRHLSTLLQDVKTESKQDALKTEAEKQMEAMKRRQEAIEEKRQKMKEEERRKGQTGESTEGNTEETKEQNAGVVSNNSSTDKEDKLFPRIDRIILYIDDLDRCPEKNVVEVLQAVHLLLAFPLFIVVVGVDPRWLLRSLERHSAVFSTEAEQNGNNRELDEDPLWQSTPMNYLEKIFQIPFTLRPINRTGFGKLVEKFATSRKEKQSVPEKAVAVVDGEIKDVAAEAPAEMAVRVAGASGSAVQPVPALVGQSPTTPAREQNQTATVVPQPSNVTPTQKSAAAATLAPAGHGAAETAIDRNPEHLQIEQWERDFMKTLHELIPSPRAGKRFINIYRLIRASVKDKERKKFIGNEKWGEYQPAQMLLAILTGYPAEATEILQKLIEHEHPEKWGEFMSSLKEAFAQKGLDGANRAVKSQGSVKRQHRDKAAEATSRAEESAPGLQRWNELLEKLEPLTKGLRDAPCTVFCDWAPKIARYSFQSGRVMLYQRD